MPRTDGDQTREQIKRVARDLFTRQGFSGTSLREIAERMDFTKAALYYHFRTKDELLVELLQPLMDASRAVLHDLEAPVRGEDRRALLRAYLEDVLLAHRALMPMLSRDPSVLAHADVGADIAALATRLVDVLSDDGSAASRVRAQAALGALHTTAAFESMDDGDLVEVLVAAAVAVLESRSA